jgi:LPXTG-motif cell wall-anchored protein
VVGVVLALALVLGTALGVSGDALAAPERPETASSAHLDMALLNRIRDAGLGSTFTIDPPNAAFANNWRKIREKTVNKVKYVLLVYSTAYQYGTFAYPESKAFDNLASSSPPNYTVSTLRGFMTKLYENADFPTVNAMAVRANLGDHRSMSATSEPTATRASDINKTDVFFPLSRKDVIDWNNYYSPSDVAPGSTKFPERNYRSDFDTYPTNTNYSMLLRTAANAFNGTNYVCHLNLRGGMMGYGAVQTGQLYNISPAVWVSTADPTPPPVTHAVTVNYVDEADAVIKASPPVTTVTNGGAFSIPAESIPVIPGHSYLHWRDGSTVKADPITLTNITADKTVYLVYRVQAPQVTVTVRYLDVDSTPLGDPSQATYSVTSGDTFTLASSSVPSFNGYGYHQWRDPQGRTWSGHDTAVSVINVTSDVTVDLIYGHVGSVSVGKVVDSLRADDKGKDFTFTVCFVDPLDQALGQGRQFTYAGGTSDPSIPAPAGGTLTLDADGQATFTLKHGQRVDIHEVPPDTKTRIIETDDPAFTTTSLLIDMGDSGEVRSAGPDTGPMVMGTANGGSWFVTFTNARTMPVPTGVTGDLSGSWALLLGAAVLVMAGFVAMTRRRRRPWAT